MKSRSYKRTTKIIVETVENYSVIIQFHSSLVFGKVFGILEKLQITKFAKMKKIKIKIKKYYFRFYV
jgi:hypothetical protein